MQRIQRAGATAVADSVTATMVATSMVTLVTFHMVSAAPEHSVHYQGSNARRDYIVG